MLSVPFDFLTIFSLYRSVKGKFPNSRIFHPKHQKGGLITWPSYLFGAVPNNPASSADSNRDYISCAAVHCGAKSILKIDISNFFDNIHESEVFKIFKDLLKFPEDVSAYLTDICCFNKNVVQGALTSSYIASAVLFDVEPKLVRRLHEKGLRYTRLVDDITISSIHSNYNFSYAKSIVVDMLHSKGLPANEEKSVVLGTTSAEALVHGLRVCFPQPRLPSKEVARIRACVQHLEKFALNPSFRTSKSYRELFDRALGRVNRLKQLGHNQHDNLLKRVNLILPKPNNFDIQKCIKLVNKLKALHPKYGDGYRYKSLYYKAQYELNILQRTFYLTAQSLRAQLRVIKPGYEH